MTTKFNKEFKLKRVSFERGMAYGVLHNGKYYTTKCHCTVSYFHKDEAFLRIHKLCRYSRIFPTFYGTQRFITMFTTALQWWSCARSESYQNPDPILSFYDRFYHYPPAYVFAFLEAPFLLAFCQNPVCIPHCLICTTCSANLILLELIILIILGKGYKL
jgi:hypothetical protein